MYELGLEWLAEPTGIFYSDVYFIQHYVIKFVSDLRQFGGFLRGLGVS
jgi:hypothetical protein